MKMHKFEENLRQKLCGNLFRGYISTDAEAAATYPQMVTTVTPKVQKTGPGFFRDHLIRKLKEEEASLGTTSWNLKRKKKRRKEGEPPVGYAVEFSRKARVVKVLGEYVRSPPGAPLYQFVYMGQPFDGTPLLDIRGDCDRIGQGSDDMGDQQKLLYLMETAKFCEPSTPLFRNEDLCWVICSYLTVDAVSIPQIIDVTQEEPQMQLRSATMLPKKKLWRRRVKLER